MNRYLLLLPLCLCASFFCALAHGADFHVIRTIDLGGDGFWDYLTVSDATRQLFVSHGSHVAVVDLNTDTLAGDIPDTPGVHGIAIAPELNRGFISCGRANVVKIFDLKTLAIIGEAKTGENPDAILFDPASKRVFAFNGRSHDATVIDAASGSVIGTIALGGKPEFARSDSNGTVWVNIEDRSQVAEIDSRGMRVRSRYSINPGEQPTGMGLDVAHHRLFSVCRNKLMTILDTQSGKVIATVAIGGFVDGSDYDPHTGLAFSSNGEGTLTIVRATEHGGFDVLQTVQTQPGARTMAIDPRTHNVYLPTGKLIPPEEPGGRYGVAKDSFSVLVVGR